MEVAVIAEELVVKSPDAADLVEPRIVTLTVGDVVREVREVAHDGGRVVALELEVAEGDAVWLVWHGGDYVAAYRGEPDFIPAGPTRGR